MAASTSLPTRAMNFTPPPSVDLNKGMVHGHQKVAGQGPLGTMQADEFHFDRVSNHLLLEGHVQNVIFGKVK